MQSEKRSTLEHYFLSSNKTFRNNEQQVEPSIAISSSLSTSEIQDHSSSNGLSDDNALSNCAVNNSTTPLTLSSSNEKTCKKSIPMILVCHAMMLQFKKYNQVIRRTNKIVHFN